MSRRLIIDTDTAGDDCFALLVGLLHPGARLEAITIVAGNVAFDQQVRNALITVAAAGRSGQVPVFPGCRAPMLRTHREASAHGDGKGNHDFPVPAQPPEAEHAVDALLRIVNDSPGEVDIVAIGPLTNIASAVIRDRGFASRVRSLSIMGGCDNSVGNVTAAAEYNFFVDPEAARVVLGAGFPVTLVTWTLTLAQAVWDRDRLDGIEQIGTPLSDFFTIVNRPTLIFDEQVGIHGSTHPDSMTAMLLMRPDLVAACSEAFVDVEVHGELTRGYSLVDRRAGRHRPNARVIDAIDADGFYAAMADLLRAGPARPAVPPITTSEESDDATPRADARAR